MCELIEHSTRRADQRSKGALGGPRECLLEATRHIRWMAGQALEEVTVLRESDDDRDLIPVLCADCGAPFDVDGNDNPPYFCEKCAGQAND